jgi:CheY-like chemotaxis protein
MEALGLLAGGVAHDFNNLLAVILSYADLLATDNLGKGALDDVDQIREAARRAADLTRQLLAFGRRQVMQMAPLNVNDVVIEAEKMLRRILGEDVELVALLGRDLGLTVLDRGQLDQILLNLTVNARDAMPDGGRLTIETKNVDLEETFTEVHPGVRPGRYVGLSVTDTGCGMDEATRARIFEPFFTTKDVGKGTGLGLATVHGIVQQSQGYIWVYSEPRHGTAFKIYFPRTDDVPLAKPPRARDRGARHATILLVEDDAAVRGVAVRILEAGGHRVVVSNTADEALVLAAAQAAEVDLLLTDVVMPRISGPDLADRFMARWPRARVLFMSGYAPRTIVLHGLLGAGVALLEKPFTPASLLDKVAEVMASERWLPDEGER